MSAAHLGIPLDECPYAALLHKPFDIDELLRTVDRVLAEAPRRP